MQALPRTLLATLGLSALVLGSTLGADTVGDTFEVNPGGWLVLETDMGSIDIQTADVPAVAIEIENAERLELSFSQDEDNVYIKGDKLDERSFFSRFIEVNWKETPKFRIVVPRHYNLDLQTSGGGIAVDGIVGEVRTRTSGGSLKFGHIRGPIQGKTSGGSIHLEEVEDKAAVHTSGGSIKIVRASGEVEANTSGGNIHLRKI